MKYSVILLLANFIFTQVNTEVFRNQLDSAGFQSKIKSSIHIASGNSDFQTIALDVHTVFRSANHNIFLISTFKRGKQKNSLFINKAFIHLRDTYQFSESLGFELFSQKEFNDFINLRDRWLLGLYSRFELLSAIDNIKVFLGLGLMREFEEFSMESKKTLSRSTNYLNIKWQINSNVYFLINTYYQPDVNNFEDYRMLSEASFKMPLSKALSFEFSINHRFDSKPSIGIKRGDLETLFGLSLEL